VTRSFGLIVLAATLLAAAPAGAETYKFKAPDGTTHFTNAPTDPRYQRMGFTSGTQAGWLRLPQGDPSPYAREITDAAGRYGIPERLVTAVIRAESGFNPRAVSRKGAQGLMQLMPSTASVLGVRNSFDPRENIEGGVRHLRGLLDRFTGNLSFAIAAYNAGEKAVLAYGGIPPYPETVDYVGKVLRYYGIDTTVSTPEARVYQTIARDGTVTYTNIPPRGRP
jgi:soluble lytic murein transglycosylase-like protein